MIVARGKERGQGPSNILRKRSTCWLVAVRGKERAWGMDRQIS